MEPPETGRDLVGRTSARLLAAGVDRRDRLDALHLLAILDATVDTTGRVRRPLDDLAGEFELAPLAVLGSLGHLERVGAVRRDGSQLRILDAEPGDVGGMQLVAFLDDVRESFDGARPPARSTWLARRGGSLVASMTALAILAVLTFTPSGAQGPLALRDASTVTAAVDPPVRGAATARVRSTTEPIAPTHVVRTPPFARASGPPPVVDDEVFAAEASPCRSHAVSMDLVACLLRDGLVITSSTAGGVTLQARAPATDVDDTTSIPVTGGLPPIVVEIDPSDTPRRTAHAIRYL